MTRIPVARRSAQMLLDDTQLLPFLPMLYMAWADGELTSQEIDNIRTLTVTKGGLDESAIEGIGGWLDPQDPPDAVALARLLRGLRERAGQLSEPRRDSLAELGIAVAEIDGTHSEPGRAALNDLEQALGLSGNEAVAEILQEKRPRPEPASWRELEEEPAFDVEALAYHLMGAQARTRRRVRDLMSRDELKRFDRDSDKATQRACVLEWLEVLADHKLGHLAYPGVLPEAGDSLAPFIAVFEELASFDLSLVVKFGVQFGLFGGSIYFLGTKRHHDAYLERVATLDLLGCFAMTELGHGSNVRDISTTATFDADTDEWIIHTPDELSRKEWIGNAALHGQMATVFAQLETQGVRHGVHAIVVPIRDDEGNPLPGVFIEDCGHKMGLNGVDNGRLWFEQVRVPRGNLLDRFASVDEEGEYTSPITSESKRFFTMLGTLVGGRVSVASAGNMASKTALVIATRYGAMRRQFGPAGEPEAPILDFRTHQRRLMPLIANAYGLDAALSYLSARFAARTEHDEREVEALAAGLKAWSTWNTTHTLQTCRECCGGQGYLSINRLPELKADSDVFTTFEGDNTVLMQLVTKGLLSAYGQQFQDLNFLSTLRFLAKSARAQLTELDPVTSRRTDAAHLRSSEWQMEMMRHREAMLISSAARRFKRRLDNGMDSFQALIEVQDHFMAVANAHITRVIMEQFIGRVEGIEEEAAREQVDALRQLFGLWHLYEDASWFMENSLFEAPKVRAMRDEINALCLQIRRQAVHLVDAFGIPERCVGAPIAHSPVVDPRGDQ